MKIVASVLLLLLFVSGNSMAGNITIWDGLGSQNEDQETEPGTINNQSWDLEGAFLRGTQLTIVGGFNFKDGQGGWTSGDIFIDVTGDAIYGNKITSENLSNKNIYGYDYVIDVDWTKTTPTYQILQINSDTLIREVNYQYPINNTSNPWEYASGGTAIDDVRNSIYQVNLTDPQVQQQFGTLFSGGYHNAVTFDIATIFGGADPNFLMHFIMECGNDNLIAAVPEPATIIISLSTLFGSVGYLRRKKIIG